MGIGNCGAPQGDSVAAEVFIKPMNHGLEAWGREVSLFDGADVLRGKCPVTGQDVDISFSSFIDDVNNVAGTYDNQVSPIISLSFRLSDCFSDHMKVIGLTSNEKKGVESIFSRGEKSFRVNQFFTMFLGIEIFIKMPDFWVPFSMSREKYIKRLAIVFGPLLMDGTFSWPFGLAPLPIVLRNLFSKVWL